MLANKPASLSFALAAAAPISGVTALQAVRKAGVAPGTQVLVMGASGGVGTFAVQIAKAFGAVVTGVCTTEKVDLVRSIGADHVLDYTRDQIGDGGRRYDVILDIGGNRSLSEIRSALEERGVLVIVGGETGGRWLGGFDRPLRAALLSPFVSQSLGMLDPRRTPPTSTPCVSSLTRVSSLRRSTAPIHSQRRQLRSETFETGAFAERPSSRSERDVPGLVPVAVASGLILACRQPPFVGEDIDAVRTESVFHAAAAAAQASPANRAQHCRRYPRGVW